MNVLHCDVGQPGGQRDDDGGGGEHCWNCLISVRTETQRQKQRCASGLLLLVFLCHFYNIFKESASNAGQEDTNCFVTFCFAVAVVSVWQLFKWTQCWLDLAGANLDLKGFVSLIQFKWMTLS